MRENVIAATKGHIVHFFLTGKEREREKGVYGNLERSGGRQEGRVRLQEGKERERKIGREEEKPTMWASNCTRTHSVCCTHTKAWKQNHTHSYTTWSKVCGHLSITPICDC